MLKLIVGVVVGVRQGDARDWMPQYASVLDLCSPGRAQVRTCAGWATRIPP